MGLFIIIKRLKASSLAWPPKEHGCGWMECCSLSRQCSHLNPLCHPSAQAHLTWPPLKASLGLLKPESLVQRNNMEDTSERISLSHAIKANLRWIQILSKYLHLFFPPITAATYLVSSAKFGLEKSQWTLPPPLQQCSAITQARVSHHLTPEIFTAEDGAPRIIKLKHSETAQISRRFAAHRPWVAAPRRAAPPGVGGSVPAASRPPPAPSLAGPSAESTAPGPAPSASVRSPRLSGC